MEGINKIEHKLNSLDFLKIIGVISICIFHAFYALDKSYEIVQYGRMSAIFVELLFMLSGFFLPNVLINKINFENFAIKRILRLFPVTFVLTIIVNLLSAHLPFWKLLPDFFLLTSIGFAQKQAHCGYAWFIYVLFWISCFYYCLLNFIKNKRFFNFILILLIYASLIILTSNSTLTFSHQQNIDKYFNIGLLRGLVSFGIGILIRVNFYKPNLFITKQKRIFLSIFELFFFVYLMYNIIFVEKASSINYIISYLIIFSIILICFSNSLGYFSCMLNNVNFNFFAKYCFSIYLMQTVPRLYLHKFGNFTNFQYVLLYLIISIILGILSYHLIELPCLKLNRGKPFGGGSL